MNQGRFLIAILLSLGVFYIYYTWIVPPPKPPAPSDQTAPSTENGQQSPAMAEKKDSAPTPDGVSPLFPVPSHPSDSNLEDEKVDLEGKEVSAQISAGSASLKSWVLKGFHEKSEESSPHIDILNHGGAGNGLYLTTGLKEHDLGGAYRLTEDTMVDKKRRLVFVWESEALRIEKEFVLASEDSSYVVDLAVRFVNKSPDQLTVSPRLWIVKDQKKEEVSGGFFSFLKGPPNLTLPAYFAEGKATFDSNWKKMKEASEITGRISWSGLSDRYFLLGLISRLESERVSTRYGRKGEQVYTSLSYGDLALEGGDSSIQKFSAYLGPKRREDLSKLAVSLEKSVDYGWFSFVAIPLLWLLIFFNKVIGNWVIAIILLTFVVKLLLHPINVKSMQSMKAMQKMQPELAALKEKYAGNKEKLNMEMMLLFKSHKVNPMGGCLPMVVQMPVYFALYKVLWNAVELYHAPFFWVFKDLSEPDPFMVTPVLLGVMMALQQKLTPQATVDPAQKKMMMIMPIMFSGFMIFLPFGLVLYILVNTIMSVVQQYMMHRDMSFVDLLRRLKLLLR